MLAKALWWALVWKACGHVIPFPSRGPAERALITHIQKTDRDSRLSIQCFMRCGKLNLICDAIYQHILLAPSIIGCHPTGCYRIWVLPASILESNLLHPQWPQRTPVKRNIYSVYPSVLATRTRSGNYQQAHLFHSRLASRRTKDARLKAIRGAGSSRGGISAEPSRPQTRRK